jgi:catalase
MPVFEKAAVAAEADDGVVDLAASGGIKAFITAAKRHRVWAREPSLRSPG